MIEVGSNDQMIEVVATYIMVQLWQVRQSTYLVSYIMPCEISFTINKEKK